jgi:2-succinyl-5-enolpyruvyl-6-hydroxy-3-cyclohexene-1-carboxylate synthase
MTPHDTYTLLRAFVDELVRCGMRHACTSPGSRSTPLVLSLVRDERLRTHSLIDERSAGFFGLGIAKATGRPVALACTSGTAAANYTPAVIEAHEARVPLVVLTADRPPELREVGAGQAIDQLKLYGDAAKWFFEVGTHEATPERLRWMRTLACRAYWTALLERPGPVHLNFPLREPLVLDAPLQPDESGRPDGRPWVLRTTHLEAAPIDVSGKQRPVLVLGRDERCDALLESANRFADSVGCPILADPLSGARGGPAAIAHYDALLRDEGFAAAQAPDLVIRAGDLPTSKPLREWLASLDAEQVVLDAEGAWQDPAGVVSTSFSTDPEATLRHMASTTSATDPTWLDAWRSADTRAAEAIAATLGDELSEPRVAAELGAALPGDATVVVASSMPVRDVETFWPARNDPPRVLSNRGANGIDGTVSTAYGVAAASDGPVVLLTGDVAVVHDLGGLAAGARLGVSLTIVLLNNDGGGIFHFLPVAGETDAFEEHVATPHGMDFAAAAALVGARHEHVTDLVGLRPRLEPALAGGGTTILEVRTDREENVALHRRVWDAVSAALS